MKKFSLISLMALLSLCAGVLRVNAATVTNDLGGTTTVTLLSETANAGTVVKDQSVYATPTDRRGLHVVHYDVPAAGVTGTVDIGTVDLPKGSILLEDAVIEVQTALIPAGSTNALAIGGITVLATGTTLNATGIDAAVATAGITTAADKLALTVTGSTATGGSFTVYMPYIMGNDQ